MDKIKSIVAFKMSELVMISKDGFPYSKVWVKEESVISYMIEHSWYQKGSEVPPFNLGPPQ